MNNARQGFSPSEIVEMFPTCKPTVRRLIKERETFLEEVKQERDDIQMQVFSGLTSYEIADAREPMIFILDVYEAEKYHGETFRAQANLIELERIMRAFEPKALATAKSSGNSITDEDIERARQHLITDLLKVSRMGKARCPFHEEKTASMHVYKDNHAFCFGCQTRADVIDLYQKIHGVEFVEAVRALI